MRYLGVLVQAEEADGVVERQSCHKGAVVVERAGGRAAVRVVGVGLAASRGAVERVAILERLVRVEALEEREDAAAVPVVGDAAAVVDMAGHVAQRVPRHVAGLGLLLSSIASVSIEISRSVSLKSYGTRRSGRRRAGCRGQVA